MNSQENIKRTYEQAKLDTIIEKDKAVLEQMKEIYLQQSNAKPKTAELSIWSIIMKSNITKFATVTVITVALILGLNTIFFSTTPAYAFKQTVEAYSGMRFIHVKNLSPPAAEPQDTWFEFDEKGELIKLRVEEGIDDSFRIMVWENDTIKWWSPHDNEFEIMHETVSIASKERAQMFADPKYAVQTLYDQMLEDKMDSIQIEQPNSEEKFIRLTAIQPISQGDSSESFQVKYVLLIDPDTKLAIKREEYISKNGGDELKSSQLLLEYNEPIDPEMFILNPPEQSNIEDRTIGIGMPQGEMTDSQAAAEVVRQYIEALIAGDYEKAGTLYNGRTIEENPKIRYLRLIAIGEPVPMPERTNRSFGVPFAFVIETADGKQEIAGPFGGLPLTPENEANLDLSKHRQAMVRPVVDKPDYWVITGGI